MLPPDQYFNNGLPPDEQKKSWTLESWQRRPSKPDPILAFFFKFLQANLFWYKGATFLKAPPPLCLKCTVGHFFSNIGKNDFKLYALEFEVEIDTFFVSL